MQRYLRSQSVNTVKREANVGGVDMIFFGVALALFMALVVIAAWVFYEIRSNQIP
jgi:flagellar biogenesis protein FliO